VFPRFEREQVLPWGWWLRVVRNGIEDADGKLWDSVRHAFWEGHMHFPAMHLVAEQLELLLRVLAAIDTRCGLPEESRHDLFQGDMLFWRYYRCWLFSTGLTVGKPGDDSLGAPLSEEGRSVLAMLLATRDPEMATVPLSRVLDAVRAAGRTQADDEREEALGLFERGVNRMPYVFAREQLNKHYLVTLTGLDTVARMPTRKIVWSQAFPDQSVRDDFFGWIAERVDRWEDWYRFAYEGGAHKLTQHLLGLFALHLSNDRRGRPV
jgi:hypothetical protein